MREPAVVASPSNSSSGPPWNSDLVKRTPAELACSLATLSIRFLSATCALTLPRLGPRRCTPCAANRRRQFGSHYETSETEGRSPALVPRHARDPDGSARRTSLEQMAI